MKPVIAAELRLKQAKSSILPTMLKFMEARRAIQASEIDYSDVAVHLRVSKQAREAMKEYELVNETGEKAEEVVQQERLKAADVLARIEEAGEAHLLAMAKHTEADYETKCEAGDIQGRKEVVLKRIRAVLLMMGEQEEMRVKEEGE